MTQACDTEPRGKSKLNALTRCDRASFRPISLDSVCLLISQAVSVAGRLPVAHMVKLEMTEFAMRKPGPPLSHSSFLKPSGGIFALTFTDVPFFEPCLSASVQVWSRIPGVAKQRIEGATKVTGAKSIARDFNARDLHDSHGWPRTQWGAIHLRARTMAREFLGVDPPSPHMDAQPGKAILGNNLASSQINPELNPSRDQIVNGQSLDAIALVRANPTTGAPLLVSGQRGIRQSQAWTTVPAATCPLGRSMPPRRGQSEAAPDEVNQPSVDVIAARLPDPARAMCNAAPIPRVSE